MPRRSDDELEQSRIEDAILAAIPTNVAYRNLVIVLAKLLAMFTQRLAPYPARYDSEIDL